MMKQKIACYVYEGGGIEALSSEFDKNMKTD
jgi:hypothetical protein